MIRVSRLTDYATLIICEMIGDNDQIISAKYLSEKKNNLGYAIDRTYTGDFKMPQFVIQNIEQKLRFHQFYIDQTIFELKRNAYIEKLIKKEIAAKE